MKLSFSHPGLLHSKTALERMKAHLDQEPWRSGFEKLRSDPHSLGEWRIRGGNFPIVCRETGKNVGNDEFARDANAAYQNALMGYLTGNIAHSQKAIAVLGAWSRSLKQITGHDKELAAALYGFKLISAAELLRHTETGWKTPEQEAFDALLRGAILPVIQSFATFANGNWDTACIKTLMAAGVYLEDRRLFDKAVAYYKSGSGNGRLTHYIINETGQCQESGRDQQHVQLGLGHLAEAAEIAWSQGIDLFSTENNRLLKGFEYTAKYNLGQEVPFVRYVDKTGKYDWSTISEQGRGRLRPIFELVWNHYGRRKGLPAPFTKEAAEKLRPEGAAFQADHPGFGTLFFTVV